MAFSEKKVHHEDFGEILLVRSSKAGRISISMKPFEPLRLTLPVFISFKKAEEFLYTKEKWIRANRERLRKLEGQYTLFTEESHFKTRDHELLISRFREGEVRVRLVKNKILVQLPEHAEIKNPQIQEKIRRGIQAAWRKEAREYLPEMLDGLSRQNQLPYNRVVIKNNRSRWGSCSEKNNINLSLHLMRLPEHLVRYVLLHELVHTVHRNHSKGFWKELERLYPGARAADRELKGYRLDIY